MFEIPFARRTALGVVLGVSEHSEIADDRLLEPVRVLPTALPPDLVELALTMAHEYCSTPARALSTMLPAGIGRGVREKRVLAAQITAAGIEALDGGGRLTEPQRALLARLRDVGQTPAAPLGTQALRRLEGRGLVEIGTVVEGRRPAALAAAPAAAHAPELTGEQQVAVEQALRALADVGEPGADRANSGDSSAESDGGNAREFVLQGVTGSGKTEVYLALAEAALAAGRGVIILVPEIALTPQALARFTARFGDVVAVMHSGLTEGARHDEWLRLSRGEARVAVGPRSAIFAPVADIGLIVVDEEHESSYKHEGDPRYDARTVAEWRSTCSSGAADRRERDAASGERRALPAVAA